MKKIIIDDIKKINKSIFKKKICIISGKNSIKNFKFLPETNLFNSKNVFVFLKKETSPQFQELKKIINFINKYKPDLIVAIGGGSVIDYAKMASTLSQIGIEKKKFNLIYRKKIFLICIPTVIGSGAESSNGCVLFNKKIKYSLEGKKFKSDLIIYIVDIIKRCPLKIRGSALLDCISQGIESIISKKAKLKSMEYSLKSLKYLIKNSRSYIKKPQSSNIIKIMNASYYSGRAISISRTSVPHALSYYCTTKYKIPHGFSVSLFICNYMNFLNMFYDKNKKIRDKLNFIIKGLKLKNYNSILHFVDSVKKIIPFNFKFTKKISYKEKMKIVHNLNLQRLQNCPKKISKREILDYVI